VTSQSHFHFLPVPQSNATYLLSYIDDLSGDDDD